MDDELRRLARVLAFDGAFDGVLPDVTARYAALPTAPITPMHRNEPNRDARSSAGRSEVRAPSPARDDRARDAGRSRRERTQSTAAPRAAVLPDVTVRDRALPDVTSRDVPGDVAETNPMPAVSPRQLAVIRELVAGRRLTEVTARTGVHRQTIWRWRREPAFQRELDRAHRAILASVEVADRPRFG